MTRTRMNRVAVTLLSVLLLAGGVAGRLRKSQVGDLMPPFSLPDTSGARFDYAHGRERVMLIAFLSPGQENSGRVVAEVTAVVTDLGADAAELDVVAVTTHADAERFFAAAADGTPATCRTLIDADYQLWGEVGVIAVPTALIVARDDTIDWVYAGHGYDFEPMLRQHLRVALGLAGPETLDATVKVEGAVNDSDAARARRHLRMADMLEAKGDLTLALAELEKARALRPDVPGLAARLGLLYCRANRPAEARAVAAELPVQGPTVAAQAKLITGWALRLEGDLQRAEQALREAVEQNPREPRAHFELGKLYEMQGRCAQAMGAYGRALELIYGESDAAGDSQP